MALIIEGLVLLIIGVFLILIANETIKLKSGNNEQIMQYAPAGGTIAIIVGLLFIVRGLIS